MLTTDNGEKSETDFGHRRESRPFWSTPKSDITPRPSSVVRYPAGYLERGPIEWSGLLLRFVVAALAAGEVAWVAELNLSLLDVVDGFAVTASARLFPGSSGHTRMLSHAETAAHGARYSLSIALSRVQPTKEKSPAYLAARAFQNEGRKVWANRKILLR